MRHINDIFINDLLRGELSFFLDCVRENHDKLSLEIRGGYISIYYKGGNLLKITYHRQKGYEFSFDSRYCLNKADCSAFEKINSLNSYSVSDFTDNFSLLMHEMDTWFDVHQKAERDFQHRLLVSNPEIVDVEYQVGNKMRLDMLAFRNGKIVMIENKFGLGSVSGNAGLAKHYADMCKVWQTPAMKTELINSIIHISDAKKRLRLRDYAIAADKITDTEILFLLADYNSKSRAAINELSQIKADIPAKILLMSSEESKIDWSSAIDCFS